MTNRPPLWRHRLAALLTVSFLSVSSATAYTPALLDTSFEADIDRTGAEPEVWTEIVQPDGKIVIGGLFDSASNVTRNNIARLNPATGSLDSSFDPDANGLVWGIVLQRDAKLLITGLFTTVDGTSQSYLARVNSDGTLDTGFAPVINNQVNAVVEQPDGKIIVVGSFTSVNSTTRNRIARLNSDGTLDASFDPNVSGTIYTLLLHPDGKMMISGYFGTVGGTSRTAAARLNSDGTLDTSFAPYIPGSQWFYSAALRGDGRYEVADSDGYPKVFCYNQDGSEYSGFASLDRASGGDSYLIRGLTLTAGNYAFLSGDFDSNYSTYAANFIGLTHSGNWSEYYAPLSISGNSETIVNGSAIDQSGKLLVGGHLAAHKGLVRIVHATAFEMLRSYSSSEIEWQRTNSAGAGNVSVDLSTDGGSTWTGLGNPSPIYGGTGWAITGLSLPSSGLIRGRAITNSGYRGMSSGIREIVLPLEGEIEVKSNSQVQIADGDTTPSLADSTDFGELSLGLSKVQTFRIRNKGASTLTINSFAVSGTHAADFTVSAIGLPRDCMNTIADDAHLYEYTFTVTFAPGAVGARNATLTINNTDADEGSYDFAITGTGVQPEINITGNGVSIVSGDVTPSSSDHTDFGTLLVAGGSISRTYTIQNTGIHTLRLSYIGASSSIGTYSISGISIPANVAPSSSTTFTVTYSSTTGGVASGTVYVYSNDADEGGYNFAVTAAAHPEINVLGNGTGITDGDATPSLSDYTDFGTALVTGEQVVSTYTIQNTGVVPLKINSITKGGTHSADFTISGLTTPTTVGYGSSKTFTVTFDPSATGLRTASITVSNDDSNEAVYDFAISGQGANPGMLDTYFNPNANGIVHTTAEQPGGKIIVGGAFTTLGGVSHVRLARLNVDGSVDAAFTASASWPSGTPSVTVLAVQPDGKILVGGDFTQVNSVAHVRLARLNSDGSLDTGFSPAVNNGILNAICLQPDGKILIAGNFTNVTGTAKTRLARLNDDGTLDTSFTAAANGNVRGLVLQDDGNVVFTGNFTTVNGTAKVGIARVDSTGTLDTGFTGTITTTTSSAATGMALALQSDGKIVAGGSFVTVNGTPKTRLARFNTDGTLDSGFTSTADDDVIGLALQADGKILVSGDLALLNGTSVNGSGRLNSNGTLDSGFIGNANNIVNTGNLTKDGSVVIGGQFTLVQTVARNRVALLVNDLATEALTKTSGSRLQWLRGSSSPEAQFVRFELSTDGGSTWSTIAYGTRISGGWEATGLSLPGSGKIRARAQTRGGKFGASSGVVETILTY